MFFVAVGLLSFFEPLVSMHPPAMGRDRWSVLEITRQLAWLDFKGIGLNLFDIIVILGPYLLMLFALVSLCFFPFQRLLGWVGVVGVGLALEDLRFRTMAWISIQSSVRCSGLVLVVVPVMLSLVFIALPERAKVATHEGAR